MNRRACLTLLLLGICQSFVRADDQSAGQPAPLKVLFIGNSYTYVNDLPGLLSGLAEAAGGRRIETAQHTPGGCSFQRHVADGKALEWIGRAKWDVVVLQEHSMGALTNPDGMQKFGRTLCEAAQKQGAKTVYYLTWARQNTPEKQDAISKAYVDLADATHATAAPVGMAWKEALSEDSNRVLHAADKSHPAPAGSYLAACVFYATLLGKSPEGLPAEIRRGDKALVKLDPTEARQLQAVAWRVVQRSEKQQAATPAK